MRPKRKEKLVSIEEAASVIKDGMTIVLGGLLAANHSMAIIRQIIKNGVKDLTLVGAASTGLDVDMLIGAGCAKTVNSSYMSGEHLIGVSPCFRRGVETGDIEMYETSEGALYSGLRAAAIGLPFLPIRGGLGSSLPEHNPDVKIFHDPIKGEPLLAIPALKPDVALIHVQQSDVYGNGQHLGALYGDRIMTEAAEVTIMTADRIVANNYIRKNMALTSIARVEYVVETPFGSHPFASHGMYAEDEEHLMEYVEAAEKYRKTGDRTDLAGYYDRYVFQPPTHEDYLELIGIKKIISLQRKYQYFIH
ncbi:MAG: CoA-transferase [Pseudomonadota bacterium]